MLGIVALLEEGRGGLLTSRGLEELFGLQFQGVWSGRVRCQLQLEVIERL